jgi:integrase
LAILKQHRRTEGYLLVAEKGRPGRPRDGKGWIYRYDPKKVWARVMQQVVAAGGRAITMYGMRHSFASNYLIAGISDVKVARWLGHADTRMVHRHYGHLLSYDGDINAVVMLALKAPETP